MSHNYAIPEGMKPSEAERGTPRQPAPIPFIHAPDAKASDETEKSSQNVKIKLRSGVYESMETFSGGTGEEFVQFFARIAGVFRKKDLKGITDGYQTILDDQNLLITSHEAVKPSGEAAAQPAEDSDDDEDDGGDKSDKKVQAKSSKKQSPKKASAKASAKSESEEDNSSDDDDDDVPPQKPPQTRLEKWSEQHQVLLDKRRNAVKAITKAVAEAFSIVELLLAEVMRDVWAPLVTKICHEPYVDKDGNEQSTPRGQSWESLALVQREFLLTVFRKDAAEQQRIYMSFYLKKPQRMTIRMFVARLEQLNNQLPFLPCLKDSDVATSETVRMNKKFTEHELGVIILRACPAVYEEQYWVVQRVLPTQVCKLREILEAIEKVQDSRRALTNGNTTKDNKKKGNGKKHSAGGGSDEGRTSKKARTEKFCQLCKDNGGAHKTHNTKECRKYDRDGTLKSSFKGKGGNGKVSGETLKNYASLKAEISTLKKEVKKASKKRSRKHSKKYESESDSDSD